MCVPTHVLNDRTLCSPALYRPHRFHSLPKASCPETSDSSRFRPAPALRPSFIFLGFNRGQRGVGIFFPELRVNLLTRRSRMAIAAIADGNNEVRVVYQSTRKYPPHFLLYLNFHLISNTIQSHFSRFSRLVPDGFVLPFLRPKTFG